MKICFIPNGKWLTTPVVFGLTLFGLLATGVITHLLVVGNHFQSFLKNRKQSSSNIFLFFKHPQPMSILAPRSRLHGTNARAPALPHHQSEPWRSPIQASIIWRFPESWGATPSHHPFLDGIFMDFPSEKPSSGILGYPHAYGNPHIMANNG